MKKICVIDTEFNAFDYEGQNNGYQEIIEIGAVVIENGKVMDRFSNLCKIQKTHELTKRCQKITGITPKDLEKGIPFKDLIYKFKRFIDRNSISNIYAYGAEDAIQLRITAKLNKMPAEIFNLIKRIKNIYPTFAEKLGLKYQCALTDICKICRVDHDAPGRSHRALYDAEDTAMAYFNLMHNDIDKPYLLSLKKHKNNVGIYDKHRSIRNAAVKPLPFTDADFIEQIEQVFDNAKHVVSQPVLMALHDDMMRIIGRPEFEVGSKEL